MLLQEPDHSPYDLRFQFLGFPVRVAWTFWIGCAVFGYGLAQAIDGHFRAASPGFMPLLLLWAACLFVSILIHELGHAIAFRGYGIDSSIVLYHFGGLAIPTSYSGRSGRLGPKQDLWIFAAGPLAQIASALVLGAVVKALGYNLTLAVALMPSVFHQIPGLTDGATIDSPGALALVTFYLYPSVLWALLNLAPVLPLDGGHIVKSLILIFGGNMLQALWITTIAGGLLAVYSFRAGQPFIGILFFIFAVSSFQAIQQSSGPRF